MRCVAVEDAWQRLASWCEHNAPVTYGDLRPPASASDLAAAEEFFPRRWPDDLRRWYALQDGAEWQSSNSPLPCWRTLSLRELTEQGPLLASMYDGEEDLVGEGERNAAGTLAFVYLPSFVPIGEAIWASYLYVDTRPGPQFGCVADHDRDEGASRDPKWASVTAMLEDVAAALEADEPCDGWRPTVEDGRLSWGR